MDKEERWRINSWPEYRKALEEMTPDNKLFKETKKALRKRGNWKNAPRGASLKPPKA